MDCMFIALIVRPKVRPPMGSNVYDHCVCYKHMTSTRSLYAPSFDVIKGVVNTLQRSLKNTAFNPEWIVCLYHRLYDQRCDPRWGRMYLNFVRTINM